MAKRDILVWNTTSSIFETNLSSNTARIKGDSANLLSLESGSTELFKINTSDPGVTLTPTVTASGDLSGSIGFETFSGKLPEGKALIKKAENSPTLCMWYAPWCGWSKKAMKPFAEAAKSNPACSLLAVNCDEHKDLAKQHGITGYPDIRLYPTGLSGDHIVHSGERTAKGLLDFIKNNI